MSKKRTVKRELKKFNGQWFNFVGEEVDKDIKGIVREYKNKYAGGTIKIFLGTDSQKAVIVRNNNEPDLVYYRFVNVVVVNATIGHEKEVRIFFRKLMDDDPNLQNLNFRLRKEAYDTLYMALELLEIVDFRNMQVHIDLNKDPKHKSNEVAAEILGMFEAQGIEAKIKPDSWASSVVADKFTK